MLHIKFSVRQTDITPTAKIAIDKSKLTLNKNSSRVQDEVEEQERKDRKDAKGRVQRNGRGGEEGLRVHLLDPQIYSTNTLISKVIGISSLFKCEIRLLLCLTCTTLMSLINDE